MKSWCHCLPGCRGPTKDMNLDLMIKMLRDRGFDDRFIQDRMRTFVGLKLPMLERVMQGPKSKVLQTRFDGEKKFYE